MCRSISVRMTQVGGRMVYSTCTFNPIEDEAVISAVLEHANGAMQLVDMSEVLPGLRRCQGLGRWEVRAVAACVSATLPPLSKRGVLCAADALSLRREVKRGAVAVHAAVAPCAGQGSYASSKIGCWRRIPMRAR